MAGLGEGRRPGPYPFPQTPIPNPLRWWHRRPACALKAGSARKTLFINGECF